MKLHNLKLHYELALGLERDDIWSGTECFDYFLNLNCTYPTSELYVNAEFMSSLWLVQQQASVYYWKYMAKMW